MGIRAIFLLLLCCSSSFFVYIIFSPEPYVSPWKPSLRFLQGRWSSRTERDFHDQGVKKEEQQWTTDTLQTEIGKMMQNDITTKRDILLQFNNSKMDKNVTGETKLQTQKSRSRKNIIILSPGRSGSSFLGEIFNNHPHVLYWFEPLHTVLQDLFHIRSAFINGNEPKHYRETAIEVINGFFQCDFGNITKTALEAFSNSLFRAKSKALSIGSSVCPPKCISFSRTQLSKVCNSYNHTVVKVLADRLPHKTIQTLKELFAQPDRYEIKLVYLVRDPRAVMYSRVYSTQWVKTYSVPNLAISLCNPILENIRFGLISPPSWLKNRFKVIRYEDLVLNAVNIAKDLYKFVEFDWSIDVEEWINEHITGKFPARVVNDPFSLYRNPSDVIKKWKSAPETFIRAVEYGCGDLMKILGYKKFTKANQEQSIMF